MLSFNLQAVYPYSSKMTNVLALWVGINASVGMNISKRGAAGPNTIPSAVGMGSSVFGIPPV